MEHLFTARREEQGKIESFSHGSRAEHHHPVAGPSQSLDQRTDVPADPAGAGTKHERDFHGLDPASHDGCTGAVDTGRIAQ